jgi:hypothetical protein
MRQRVARRTALFLLTAVALWSADAAAALIYPMLSRDSLTLGERIELTVALVTPPGAKIQPPPTDNGFGPMVVKDWTSNRKERKSSDSITYSYQLTVYEVAQCSIPKLPFIVMAALKQDTLYTEMRPIRVISVLARAGQDSVKVRDLKPPLIAGKPSLLWLWLIVAAIVAAGAVFLGRYLYVRNKKSPPPPPPQPPYEEAIAALLQLEAKEFLIKGLVREYTFEISDILKRYIGRRFDVNAADFTTEEMLGWIDRSPLSDTLRRLLMWFFNATDPVKFARMVPAHDTIVRFGVDVRSFLEETKPRPVQAVETALPNNQGAAS